jgi:RNA polymerase-binding transcription factor DksA
MPDWTTQRKTLQDRLSELDERLHKIEDKLDQPHSKDFEDFATETEDTEVMEDLGNAGLKEIEMIKAALMRIDNNVYGICQRCGDDIAPERLTAVPFTPLCVKCATKAGNHAI